MPANARQAPKLDAIWMMRCPVPAASGVAYALGYMNEAFGRDGIAVRRVVEDGLNLVVSDPQAQSRHFFREGGNIQALAAKATLPTVAAAAMPGTNRSAAMRRDNSSWLAS